MLTLKATKKPLNLPIILGAAGIVVVILLLVIVLLRGGGGGGKGKRSNNPPPAPVVAGGGGAPPYQGGGYGGGGGGGYGASALQSEPAAAAAFAPAPVGARLRRLRGRAGLRRAAGSPRRYVARARAVPAPLPPPPDPGGGGYPLASAGGAPVVQVRCPACNMLTMASPGQASVCFSCGQPLPQGLASGRSRTPRRRAAAPARVSADRRDGVAARASA